MQTKSKSETEIRFHGYKIIKTVRSVLSLLPIAFLAFHLFFFIAFGIRIANLRDNNPSSTSLIKLRATESGKEAARPTYTGLTGIPGDLVRTILFAEDGYFYRHGAISLRYIENAIRINRELGYPAYGASTITQQLARTLFLSPEKSYARKYLELLIALELETMLSKDRILELYINYCEMGNGVFGFTDAAAFYFDKNLFDLSVEEKLRLVTIMPSPLSYSPHTFAENEILTRRYASIRRYYEAERRRPPRFESTIIEIEEE